MASAVIGSLRVNLGMDTAAFNDSLKNTTKSLDAAAKRMRQVGAVMTAAITAPLVAFGAKSVSAFQKQEKAIASMEATLKSMGSAAGFTSRQLQDMASDLQKVSTFGDEDILQGVIGQLLTFGSVAGDEFSRASALVVDLSAKLGTGLQQSAIQVGKALNDPVRGLTSLRLVGIQFSAEQEDLIKRFVETGQVAKAQGIILGELERQFGGAAEAIAKTNAGQMAQAWNAWGDAMESVGAVVAQVLPPIANVIKSIAQAFQGLSPETQQFVVIAGALAAAVGPVLIALGALVTFIGGPLTLAFAGIVLAVAGIKAAWSAWGEDITNVTMLALELVTITFTTFKENVLAIWTGLVEGIMLIWTGFTERISVAMTTVTDFIGNAWQALSDRLWGNSIIPEMIDGMIAEFQRGHNAISSLSERTANNIQKGFVGMSKSSLGVLGSLASSANSILGTLFGESKKFSLAQAIIGTLAGMAFTLATTPYPANLAAAAQVGAFGFAQVAAVGATNIGGGGAHGAPSVVAPAPQEPQEVQQSVNVSIQGDNFSGDGIRGLLDEINSYIADGGRPIRVT